MNWERVGYRFNSGDSTAGGALDFPRRFSFVRVSLQNSRQGWPVCFPPRPFCPN
jgi:hypothetical protein